MTTPPDAPRPTQATAFSFDALRRAPDVEAPDLVAVDATDRLLLDEAAAALATAGPGEVVVVGDRYGALTLGAVALHGATGVRVHQDELTGELALAANAERAGLVTPSSTDALFTQLPFTPDLVRGARVILLQLPRSLDALDDVAALVAAHAAPDVVLLAGGRVKHMTPAMNGVLGRHFAELQARLARQKSRVLVATGPRRPDDDATATAGDTRWGTPARHHDADLDLVVCAYPGAFAGARVDLGTRALAPFVERAVPDAASAVDLGCGTGVLATLLARTHPGAQVLATDVSAAAAASAHATAAANGVADRVTVRRDHGLASVPDASVDLVVLNPPFHTGAAVHTGIARHLFAEAGRALRPGGELWAVWNSHLQYRPVLERLVGPTRQVHRNPTFTVTASRRA
ncbi:SAM-dependent methyltransferase [Actinotalea ferrariae CF5-4]|uniref:SAM-dependent methyltransferase n=1 Tax=Actinotalea ferrariae CF5-4 TaxID=948458 RepID=A0A021W1F1_9CELL|nr:methyltransferase [Actinotalea ferrariae]EYR65157.1 SAM-dependent methyltransferase [Actinotalea ferrariae CF5-4]